MGGVVQTPFVLPSSSTGESHLGDLGSKVHPERITLAKFVTAGWQAPFIRLKQRLFIVASVAISPQVSEG